MLQPATLSFLRSLKKNNNKNWFDENRKKYEAARADFLNLTSEIIRIIGAFDKPIASLEAKKTVFRINRDIRFSKDKSPYKTNMGASFNKGGKKIHGAGYYFHCEPGASFLAAGLYMPEAADLQKVRQEVDYRFPEWKAILESKSFKKIFPGGVDGVELLSRPPKGYEADNPAIDYLKMKSFIISHPIKDEELTDKKILKKADLVFQQSKKMIDFLNEALT